MKSFRRIKLKCGKKVALIIFLFLFSNFNSFSQDNDVDNDISESQQDVAPVTIDGNVLFNVRGVSTYPAKLRAESISRRIERVAANESVTPDSIKAVPALDRFQIFAGNL